MGTRLQVRLTVPAALRTEAEDIVPYTREVEEDLTDSIPLVTYVYEEVNYGELQCLKALENAGIPYDSWHESAHDFEAQTNSARFSEHGDAVLLNVCDDSGFSIGLGELQRIIDDHDALRKLINQRIAVSKNLPWDNQLEYRKTYLMKKLVTE